MIDKLFEGKHGVPVVLVGTALLTPSLLLAGPESSSADMAACLVDSDTTHVCSSKELSNIVVQCGDSETESSYFYKYDDLDDVENWPEGQTSPYAGDFSCPEGGELIAVFVKSGRDRYDGPALEGLPPGVGAIWSPLACSAESTCPPAGDEEEAE